MEDKYKVIGFEVILDTETGKVVCVRDWNEWRDIEEDEKDEQDMTTKECGELVMDILNSYTDF